MPPIGAAQLEQARARARGFIRSAGGSGRRRDPETGVGAVGRAGVDGPGRRGGLSFTEPAEGVSPFLSLGPTGSGFRWRVGFI